jgi:hypothetical protein
MGYPLHMISFDYKDMFSKSFKLVGDLEFSDEIFIEGDLKNMDFIAYYGNRNHVGMVVGSPS